jgi:c-di-GMP-binding flagellar brake protein YcgR
MKVGIELEIQIEGVKGRLKGELIAVEEDKFLIIKLPSFQSLGNAAKLTYAGTNIIIRYIHDGTMFGFKSSVLHFMFEPIRLVFIKCPKKIESQDLRTHKRISCYLPANVIIIDQKIEGAIIDISRNGCYFTTNKAKVENNQILQVGNEISVIFYLPGEAEELTIAGKQKTTKTDKDSVNIGIEFDNMSIKVEEKLYGFLLTACA